MKIEVPSDRLLAFVGCNEPVRNESEVIEEIFHLFDCRSSKL